jgi:hypothetical protein
MAPTLETEPSNYMQTLTRYLSNIMNSTLLGLPREIKELIYFDALSHAANMILVCQARSGKSIVAKFFSLGFAPVTRCEKNKP